jgi:hypothetical protein
VPPAHSRGNPTAAVTACTVPISPEVAISSARCSAGRNRVQTASIRNSPRSRARSTSSCASRALMVIGFSQSTDVPAVSAARTTPACWACGVAT